MELMKLVAGNKDRTREQTGKLQSRKIRKQVIEEIIEEDQAIPEINNVKPEMLTMMRKKGKEILKRILNQIWKDKQIPGR